MPCQARAAAYALLGMYTALSGALLLTATEVVGDTAAKLGDKPLITYGSYLALAHELQLVFRNNGIALTNAYWNAFTNVTHTILGAVFFGEKLSNYQYAGIGLVTVGILLLGHGDAHGT